MNTYRIAIFLLFNLHVLSLKSQNFGKVSDWSIGVEKKHDAILGVENVGLLRGIEYKLPVKGETTHPFFESQAGSNSVIILKNENVYYNVPLLYDLYQKQIAVKYLREDGRISLIQLDITIMNSVHIFEHEFRKFQFGSNEELFDVLFEKGKSLLLAKRSKVLEVESPTKVECVSVDKFFWVENGLWEPIAKASDYFRIASERNNLKGFQQFLKEHKIKLRKINELEMLTVAKFFTQSL